MKKFILKRSQLFGLRTFGWEVKLKLYGLLYPSIKPLGIIVGKINNGQMKLHSFLMRNL